MPLKHIIKAGVFQYSDGVIKPAEADLISEYSVSLSINGKPVASIACTGSDLKHLSAGYLFSEGVISSYSDIKDIIIHDDIPGIDVITGKDEEMIERLMKVKSISSGCGQEQPDMSDSIKRLSPQPIKPAIVLKSFREFLKYSELHRATHGVHSAALYDTEGTMESFFDDIGRHNAVDKIIGHALQNRIVLSSKMLLSTGRMSSEITGKAVRASIPVLISRSSPTAMSYELARKYNLVMIGRVRAGSFIIFNGNEYIKAE
jgi:FdhD protein